MSLERLYKLDKPVMTQAQATAFGSFVTKLHTGRIKQPWIDTCGFNVNTRQSTDSTDFVHEKSNFLRLSSEHLALAKTALDLLLEHEAQEPTTIDSHIVLCSPENTPSEDGDWHQDPEDLRIVVNLHKEPLQFEYAYDWSNDPVFSLATNEQARIYPTIAGKTAMITYKPGEAIVLDNRCPINERVPHAGSMMTSQTRALLRISTRFD